MRKARPGGASGNGPEAAKKKSHKQYSTPRHFPKIAPTAVESAARLQRFRFSLTCWNALGRPDRMPQPSDFGLCLRPLQPHEVLWGAT